ncbi:MAG: hypothetical protein ACOVNY_09250 [Chitinophagaceae bacterium]
MKEKINWSKFVKGFLILLPILLLFDIVFDIIKGKIVWEEIWAMKNLFFKLLAALVGAYFYSTFNNKQSDN